MIARQAQRGSLSNQRRCLGCGPVALSQRNGDLRRKKSRSSQWARFLAEAPPDGCGGCVAFSFRKVQQGETGVGVTSQFMGLMKRVSRFGEIAAPETDLANQVLRFSGIADMEIAQLVKGASRIKLCLPPCTPQADNISPMDAAHPRKAGDRHPLAPATSCFRPLAGAAIVGHRLAKV